MAFRQLRKEPVEHKGQAYLPISIASIRPGTAPVFDLYLRPSSASHFVLYCERNTTFTHAARQQLETNQVQQLYINRRHRPRYNQYLAGHLREIIRDPHLNDEQKAEILYDSAQAVVAEVLAHPDKTEAVQQGKDVMRFTVDILRSPEFPLEFMLRTISCDYYLYTHSVNVTTYSIALAMVAGYRDKATLREVANGALFHDIGKSLLPEELLNKAGALTSDEAELMRHYPAKGHELLEKKGILGEVALDIVLHHQERLDGSGYPDGLSGDEISPFVRIVSIADVFDALTTDRVHQKGRNTFDAIAMMNRTMRLEIDAGLLRRFVSMMGLRV